MSEEQQYQHGNNDDNVLDEIDSLIEDAGEVEQEPEHEEIKAETLDDEAAETAEEPEETQEPDNDAETQEIDYDLEIPMSDGRDPMKLGEMKDAINNLERDKQATDALRMQLIKQETEINQYLGQTGAQVPPEFTRYMQEKQEAHLRTQHDLMLKMMPELAEPAAFNKMRDDIVEVAKGSNFSAEEISQVSDARVVHLLHRLADLEAKQAKAQETVHKLKSVPKPKGQKARNTGPQSKFDKQYQSALSGSQADKDAMVDALLSGT